MLHAQRMHHLYRCSDPIRTLAIPVIRPINLLSGDNEFKTGDIGKWVACHAYDGKDVVLGCGRRLKGNQS